MKMKLKWNIELHSKTKRENEAKQKQKQKQTQPDELAWIFGESTQRNMFNNSSGKKPFQEWDQETSSGMY